MKLLKVFAHVVVRVFLRVKNIVEIADKNEISKFIMNNNYKNFINNEVLRSCNLFIYFFFFLLFFFKLLFINYYYLKNYFLKMNNNNMENN